MLDNGLTLDLREIIEIPGSAVTFSHTLDSETLQFPGVEGYVSPPRAEGDVRNIAGALELNGTLEAEMTLLCDRCAKPFGARVEMRLNIPLAADLTDEDNPDIFPLEGDHLNLRELLETYFILNMDSKRLCKPGCAGLCESCGADLNEAPCSCAPKTDPRLTVLSQLLNIEERNEQ